MEKLKIYLSNLTYDTISIATDAFPLNIGCLASYCGKKFEDKVDISLFSYIDELDKKIQESPPDILGMSNYIWNYNIGREFFKMMKKKNPNTILVWGGPNFPLDWPSQEKFMERHSEFDIYVPIRGELGFTNIVEKVLEKGFPINKYEILNETIPGCITRDQTGKVSYAFDNKQIKKLDEIPSPYTTGILNKFFDGKLNPLIQTSRGCPFECTFCTDGSDLVNQVNQFSKSYIANELQYIVEHVPDTVHTLHIADLNFGMLRGDLETCKVIKNLEEKYGYPKQILATTGKNRKEQIIDALHLLDGTMSLYMSVQSMDKQVLTNIRRDNISLDHMMALAPAIKETGLLTKVEVILGLPGESYQSHIDTIRKMVAANMDDITIFTCIVLQGSELATPKERKKWDFKTKFRIVPRCFGVLSNGKKICEYEEVIIGSNSFTFDEYVELRLVAFVMWVNTKGVVFDSIMKFLRELGVDVFELHHNMVKNSKFATPEIIEVFNKFKKATIDELFDSPEEIVASIQNEKEYQKLLNEEIGINVVASYHAYVLFEIIEQWSNYLIKTAQNEINEKIQNNNEIKKQFEQIVNYTLGCSFNPLGKDRQSTNPEYMFDYDIKKWLADYNGNPLKSFKLDIPKKISFRFTDQQFKTVEDTVNRYADSLSGKGLAMKSISVMDLWRHTIEC